MQSPRPERECDRLAFAHRSVRGEARDDGNPPACRISQLKLWLAVCELAPRRWSKLALDPHVHEKVRAEGFPKIDNPANA